MGQISSVDDRPVDLLGRYAGYPSFDWYIAVSKKIPGLIFLYSVARFGGSTHGLKALLNPFELVLPTEN